MDNFGPRGHERGRRIREGGLYLFSGSRIFILQVKNIYSPGQEYLFSRSRIFILQRIFIFKVKKYLFSRSRIFILQVKNIYSPGQEVIRFTFYRLKFCHEIIKILHISLQLGFIWFIRQDSSSAIRARLLAYFCFT